MSQGDVPGDCQAQPHAALGASLVYPVEAIKYARQVFGGNATTCIGDGCLDDAVGRWLGVNRNPALVGVFDGIV